MILFVGVLSIGPFGGSVIVGWGLCEVSVTYLWVYALIVASWLYVFSRMLYIIYIFYCVYYVYSALICSKNTLIFVEM